MFFNVYMIYNTSVLMLTFQNQPIIEKVTPWMFSQQKDMLFMFRIKYLIEHLQLIFIWSLIFLIKNAKLFCLDLSHLMHVIFVTFSRLLSDMENKFQQFKLLKYYYFSYYTKKYFHMLSGLSVDTWRVLGVNKLQFIRPAMRIVFISLIKTQLFNIKNQ